MVHFTMTPSYSVVSEFGNSNPGSIHLGVKRRKKSKRSFGSFTRTYGVIQRWNRLWCTHAIPFQTTHPTLILSSRHGCTVSMNIDHPQEYKTALMSHLFKQQDHFISLDLVLNPYIKLPLRHGASHEKRQELLQKYILPRTISF